MKIIHNITLDASKQGIQATIPITQHDAGAHQVVAMLRNGTETVTLTEKDSAALYFPSGDILDPVTVYTENGAIPCRLVYDVSAAASAEIGMRRAVFNVVDGDGLILFSPEIAFFVREDLMGGSLVAESPQYAAVIQARMAAEAAARAAEETAEGVTVSTEAAEEAALRAEESAAQANTAVLSSGAAVSLAENAALRAETAERSAKESAAEAALTVEEASEELLKEANAYTDSAMANLKLVRILSALPEEGEADRLYLIPKDASTANDLFDEYLWVNKGSEDAPDWGWEWFSVTSIDVDLTGYVKQTDYATAAKAGIIRTSRGYGFFMDGENLVLCPATEEQIDSRTPYVAITPRNLDYAVKSAGDQLYVSLEDHTAAASDTEQRLSNLEAAAEGKLYVTATARGATVTVPKEDVLPYGLLCAIGGDTAIARDAVWEIPSTVGDLTVPEHFREDYASLCVGSSYFDLAAGKHIKDTESYTFDGSETYEYDNFVSETAWAFLITFEAPYTLTEVISFSVDGTPFACDTVALTKTDTGTRVTLSMSFAGEMPYTEEDPDLILSTLAGKTCLFTVAAVETPIEVDFDCYVDVSGGSVSADNGVPVTVTYMTRTSA